MNDYTIPHTTIPCPDWCELPAGHGFDSEDRADPTLEYRSHSRTISDAPTGRGEKSVAVDIVTLESARHEQLVGRTPVAVILTGYQEGDNITGPQARQVAAALLDAADEWDRITGASS